jgi:hypothetical protein
MSKEKNCLISFFDSLVKAKLEGIYNVDCSGKGFRNDLEEEKLVEYFFNKMLGKEEFKIKVSVPYEEGEEFYIRIYLQAESSDGYYMKFYGIDNAYASIVYLDDNGELIKICNQMSKRMGYYISMNVGDILEIREDILFLIECYINDNELRKEYDIWNYSEDIEKRPYREFYRIIYHFKKKEE